HRTGHARIFFPDRQELAIAQTACRSSKNTLARPPCRGKLAETMIKAESAYLTDTFWRKECTTFPHDNEELLTALPVTGRCATRSGKRNPPPDFPGRQPVPRLFQNHEVEFEPFQPMEGDTVMSAMPQTDGALSRVSQNAGEMIPSRKSNARLARGIRLKGCPVTGLLNGYPRKIPVSPVDLFAESK
ncbi:MAG: hypothetical protein V2B19_02945, partial [Pseudomonadota bacterium]